MLETQFQQGFGNIGPLVKNKRLHQRGGGCLPQNLYYSKNKLQVGSGVGSVFAALGRILLPIVTKGFSTLKSQGIKKGISLLKELQQEPVKNFIAAKSSQLIDNLTEKGLNKLNQMSGAGVKRKRLRRQKKVIRSKRRKTHTQSISRSKQIKSLLNKSKCNRKKPAAKQSIKRRPSRRSRKRAALQDIFT